MRWNYTCPVCGCNLDPGEKCMDCEEKRERKKERREDATAKITHREIPWGSRKYA